MTPIFFFFTLCIPFAGSEDCTFEWEILPLDEIQDLYVFYEGKLDHTKVGGFTVASERKLFASSLPILLHEIEHAYCILENKELVERQFCNFRVDSFHLVQGSHDVDPTPTPPIISEKLRYTMYNW